MLSSRRNFIAATGAAAAGFLLGTGTDGRCAGRRSSGGSGRTGAFRLGRTLYRNPLKSADDLRDFRLEGQAIASFPNGRMRLENRLDPSLGQKSNFVYWFPMVLPDSFAASWEFQVLREPGLCMVFFAARGRDGRDLFAPGLAPRTGEYPQYHHGDIDTLHLSYFRRSLPSERALHVCNLRKSYGFNLVAEGADPLPSPADGAPACAIDLVKCGTEVAFYVNRLPVLGWRDDGRTFGRALGAGRFGFRQLAPLIAEYSRFSAREVSPV